MQWSDRSRVTGRLSVIDVASLFSQILSSFWWVISLFVLAALFKSAWFKPKKEASPLAYQIGKIIVFCSTVVLHCIREVMLWQKQQW